jgi:hypothetical protein
VARCGCFGVQSVSYPAVFGIAVCEIGVIEVMYHSPEQGWLLVHIAICRHAEIEYGSREVLQRVCLIWMQRYRYNSPTIQAQTHHFHETSPSTIFSSLFTVYAPTLTSTPSHPPSRQSFIIFVNSTNPPCQIAALAFFIIAA